MSIKNILAIFIVSLFAAVVLAKPTASQNEDKIPKLCHHENRWTSTEEDLTIPPSLQLIKVIMFDLQNLTETYAEKIKNVSDLLLKDDVVISNKSPAVIKFKDDIEEFQKKFTDCNDELDELFDLLSLYFNATSQYYEMEANSTLSSDTKIVYDVLKKYSPKNLEEEIEKEFGNSEFVNKFGQKITELKKKLLEEEGDMGAKILQWWDKTKSLKTAEEKAAALRQFMELYEEDDE